MPTAPLRSTTPTIDIYVKLAQYPILCDRIRLQMREEIFRRGIISHKDFEKEVKQIATESQRREGLNDPTSQEDEATWQKRLDAVRELHTDMYFANNLGSGLLEQLIDKILNNKELDSGDENTELTFNPEIAPWALLFKQGEIYDALPPPKKELVKHHLEEIKVVLIKRLLSDQLPFIAVAKKVFTIRDLHWIYERLIGGGKIGGKAGGMMLAWKILSQNKPEIGPIIAEKVGIPETFFIGSEIIYEFIYFNQYERFVNQKYLPLNEIKEQYPDIVHAFLTGSFPDYIQEQLEHILQQINGRPFVVRSSSLLEDHLAYAFAGQYKSCFCPNQGTFEENFANFQHAIKEVYASTFNPKAMAERQKNGLIDYDERMAIMVQPLIGHQYGRYFIPTAIGTGLSQEKPQNNSNKPDGHIHLTWGFAERTVGSQMQTYCNIDLANPKKFEFEQQQKEVRALSLDNNAFQNLPLTVILDKDYPLRDFIFSSQPGTEKSEITFQKIAQDPKFIKLMRTILQRLRTVYKKPVIIEFSLDIVPTITGAEYKLYILQCHTDKNMN